MSDNWKNFNVEHPKKGLVPIKNLSNNEKGRAIVDLSHRINQMKYQAGALNEALELMALVYQNHILSLAVCTPEEREEIFK